MATNGFNPLAALQLPRKPVNPLHPPRATMSDSEELLSSSISETGANETGANECSKVHVVLARRATRFSAAQRAFMNAYYVKGMVGTGKKHRRLIKKAAKDAGLSTPQVKVSRQTINFLLLTLYYYKALD